MKLGDGGSCTAVRKLSNAMRVLAANLFWGKMGTAANNSGSLFTIRAECPITPFWWEPCFEVATWLSGNNRPSTDLETVIGAARAYLQGLTAATSEGVWPEH